MCSIAIVVLASLACASNGQGKHRNPQKGEHLQSQEAECLTLPGEELAGRGLLQHANSNSRKNIGVHSSLENNMTENKVTENGAKDAKVGAKAPSPQPGGWVPPGGPQYAPPPGPQYGYGPPGGPPPGYYGGYDSSRYQLPPGYGEPDPLPTRPPGYGEPQMMPTTTTTTPYSLAFGPDHYYCEDGSTISESGSTGLEDCKSRCNSEAACKFMSFWETGGVNWCRISRACVNWLFQWHSISMYQKGLSATPSTYAYFFSDYMPLSCGSWYYGMLSEGPSFGQVNCEERCSADPACKFISLWSTGGVNWCRLSDTCDYMTMQQHSEGQITIYRKP